MSTLTTIPDAELRQDLEAAKRKADDECRYNTFATIIGDDNGIAGHLWTLINTGDRFSYINARAGINKLIDAAVDNQVELEAIERQNALEDDDWARGRRLDREDYR